MKVLNLYNPPPFHPLAYVPPPPPHIATQYCQYTDKKRKQNYPHILRNSDGIGAMSYMRKDFLINEELRKYFTI
jgi:hypothetical protein